MRLTPHAGGFRLFRLWLDCCLGFGWGFKALAGLLRYPGAGRPVCGRLGLSGSIIENGLGERLGWAVNDVYSCSYPCDCYHYDFIGIIIIIIISIGSTVLMILVVVSLVSLVSLV